MPYFLDASTNTYRYYFTGSFFDAGPVTVRFVGGSWADKAGNKGAESTQIFGLIKPVQPTEVDRVFFIELSGGMQLNGLGFTSEPIIEIPENNCHFRVEDTILITDKGPEVLSSDVPNTPSLPAPSRA